MSYMPKCQVLHTVEVVFVIFLSYNVGLIFAVLDVSSLSLQICQTSMEGFLH